MQNRNSHEDRHPAASPSNESVRPRSTEVTERQSVTLSSKWLNARELLRKTSLISDLSRYRTVGCNPIFIQGLVTFSVSLYAMVVGYTSAYTAPAFVSMAKNSSTIHPTAQEESWIGSLMPLSALFGGFLGGLLIETIGRRATIMATAAPFTASFIIIGSAQHVWVIMGGRVLAGLSVGIISLGVPIYLGEILQPEVRGMFGIFPTALGNFGILLCFFVGYWLEWREIAYFGASLPVAPFILMFFVPESPIWYIRNGKMKKARIAVEKLRGKDMDVSAIISSLYKSSQSQLELAKKSSFKDILRKHNQWALGICLGLMFFQQFSGINAMIFNTVFIFEEAGSSINSNLAAIIIGLVNLASTIVASFLVDRIGRKILLYGSSGTMSLMLITLGTFIYFQTVQVDDVSVIGWVPLVTLFIFVIGFSMGAGPIPWLMMGEILPAKYRGTLASITTSFNWTCAFVVTKTFADMNKAMGTYGTFWFFGVICAGFLVFTIIAVPETRGKSLKDIEKKFRGEN